MPKKLKKNVFFDKWNRVTVALTWLESSKFWVEYEVEKKVDNSAHVNVFLRFGDVVFVKVIGGMC